MKKKVLISVVVAILALSCIACGKAESVESDKSASVDSKYDEFVEKVVGNRWSRDTIGCVEIIYFTENGDYGYYEVCGSPVGDHDLYDIWEYDKKNDMILLKGYPGTAEPEYDENPTKVKYNSSVEYISCDGETLVMFIDGEERTFTKE